MTPLIIFDFNRTLYNPDLGKLEDFAIEVLENLSKRATLILLGKGNDSRETLIQELQIQTYFEKIILVPEKTIEQLNVIKKAYPNSSKFFSIGDRIKGEIFLGNKMGFQTIWLKQGKFMHEEPENDEERPWKTIHSIQDILKYI